ncbi:hypothetical protein M3650_29085 [Paenibacillus sp. MER TA 81-3]|uniref:hypothetical protein n=1 Tax=Paenibacillus sp. MER TA 81-3 TaxID=2939573 RepID=UPI00203C2749|nr:hypothetical protein [Paenibacillus sp. MER TA 81-3]MCM3342568.1 hypothetical protein [Paenibacillus sp. MER TA 81-3]
MGLSEQLVLWNQASIKMLDIRHITMKYQANRFHILHGGKGEGMEDLSDPSGIAFRL